MLCTLLIVLAPFLGVAGARDVADQYECPDPRSSSRVSLTVLDPSGAPLASYRMRVDGQPIDPSCAFVEPGPRVIEIYASNYKPLVVPLDVGPDPSQIIVQLAPAPSLGSQLVESLADALDPPTTERVIRFDERIQFASSSTTLDRSARRTLRLIADRIRAHPEIARVRVAGYSDRRGPDDANPALSLARAKAVCAYLMSQGVRSDRLAAVGSAEHDPYLAGADDWNRRVEFQLTLKDDDAGVESELNHGGAHDEAAVSG